MRWLKYETYYSNYWSYFGAIKDCRYNFLLVGVINFMISGVANAPFLWVGFGMYAAGMLVDILGSDNN